MVITKCSAQGPARGKPMIHHLHRIFTIILQLVQSLLPPLELWPIPGQILSSLEHSQPTGSRKQNPTEGFSASPHSS